ncbi:hypothetical protein PKCEKB_PKCEKB_12375, partial [Dysosmobacter welbionis]
DQHGPVVSVRAAHCAVSDQRERPERVSRLCQKECAVRGPQIQG